MLAAFFSEENGMRILIKDNNRPIAVLYWDSAVIRKYNHHHDKLGRFASADGSSGDNILSELGRHKPGDKVDITDQAIKKVPEKASEYLSDDENKALHDMNVAVLTESMKHNNSDEVAMAFDGKETSHAVFGDQFSVDVEADTKIYHFLRATEPRSVILTHNHPGKSGPSAEDFLLFLDYPTIKCLSIITNSGKSINVVRTRDITPEEGDELFDCLKNNSAKHSERESVDIALKQGYNFGIRYER